ncbi:hypothetical protein AKJ09_04454 [Labilithrix luteola]|uniref:Uncharacterized protein n=1 Tax=Labilithrix luteola TaxID=1391654 RepID=A0A0K1PW93_9BACT|nr:hypothetical protein [Labilithrix luteola]AKU97790.1 hypothetical protein AKJ09_04454 [Labilithrix luteola]
MDGGPLPTFDVAALHARLRERIAEVQPPVVADLMRVFLEVSVLPCELRLWSLEFAFDEDDGRIARMEARFAKPDAAHRDLDELDDLRGYEVQILLPKIIPNRAPAEDVATTTDAEESAPTPRTLVTRFLRALADLGSYRSIETVEARSATVLLV